MHHLPSGGDHPGAGDDLDVFFFSSPPPDPDPSTCASLGGSFSCTKYDAVASAGSFTGTAEKFFPGGSYINEITGSLSDDNLTGHAFWQDDCPGGCYYDYTVVRGAVPDTTPPVISTPGNITELATSSSGKVVTYPLPSATDDIDPSPFVTCSPASGSTSPLGDTTVTCTATDAAGNSSSASFTVTVKRRGVHSVEFTQAIQKLQPLEELKADLEGDGEPPVPMVAGKPTIMRVYLDEVALSTEFQVEVSGVTSGSRTVTVAAGCTPLKQRLQQGGCVSVDFGFTAPTGSWNVTVSASESGGGVGVADGGGSHTFNVTSETGVSIKLVPIPVCHTHDPSAPPGFQWTCGIVPKFGDILPFFKSTFPGKIVLDAPTTAAALEASAIKKPTPSANKTWWALVLAEVDRR